MMLCIHFATKVNANYLDEVDLGFEENYRVDDPVAIFPS